MLRRTARSVWSKRLPTRRDRCCDKLRIALHAADDSPTLCSNQLNVAVSLGEAVSTSARASPLETAGRRIPQASGSGPRELQGFDELHGGDRVVTEPSSASRERG